MLALYKVDDIVMLFNEMEITATQMICQKVDSGYRKFGELESKSQTNVSCLVKVCGRKRRITSRRFGLTCTIKELSERYQRVVPESFIFPYWRDEGQKHVILSQPPVVLRNNLIVRGQTSTINQTFGETNTPRRIVEDSSRVFYAELSHQHSNNGEVSRQLTSRTRIGYEIRRCFVTLTKNIKKKP